ncbi:MAG: preprotein translocase subunit SecG [Nitrospinaceae bacterium]
MGTLLIVLHIIAALFLIMVVLLQQGKGASMGAAFGAGSSQTVFGSSGAGNLLTKLTAAAAVVFMVTSLTLATFSKTRQSESVIDQSGVTSSETKEPSQSK